MSNVKIKFKLQTQTCLLFEKKYIYCCDISSFFFFVSLYIVIIIILVILRVLFLSSLSPFIKPCLSRKRSHRNKLCTKRNPLRGVPGRASPLSPRSVEWRCSRRKREHLPAVNGFSSGWGNRIGLLLNRMELDTFSCLNHQS